MQWLEFIHANPLMHFYSILDENEEFCGFITEWKLNGFSYVEHFATLSALRGKGIGGKAFDTLLQTNPSRAIIIEVEPQTDEAAKRRISFYRKHGMHLYTYPYIQPPYASHLRPLPLLLMGNEETLSSDRLKGIEAEIHRHVYGCK